MNFLSLDFIDTYEKALESKFSDLRDERSIGGIQICTHVALPHGAIFYSCYFRAIFSVHVCHKLL